MMIENRGKVPVNRDIPPEVKNLLGMLVPPSTNSKSNMLGGSKHGPITLPPMMSLQKLSSDIAVSKNDAKNLFQILPDMGLAASILISAILSPGDLSSINLFYRLNNLKLNTNISGAVIRRIEEFFTNDYRIKSILPDILYSILIESGSYPVAILPQSTLDQAINSSDNIGFESIKPLIVDHIEGSWYKCFGLLGGETNAADQQIALESFSSNIGEIKFTREDYKVNLESFSSQLADYVSKVNKTTEAHVAKFNEKKGDGSLKASTLSLEAFSNDLVEVNDNPELLKNPLLLERLRQSRVQQVYAKRGYGAALEAHRRSRNSDGDNRMSLEEVEERFYPDRKYSNVPLMALQTPLQTGGEASGHPVVMNLPSEAVLPIFIPGSPKQHVGYFILLDINGNPVNISFRDDYYSDIRSAMGIGGTATSHLTTMTRRAQDGYNVWQDGDADHLAGSYWDILEANFKNRLRNGFQNGNYEISHTEELKLMMFARACAGKKTTVLYVPRELLIYMAFDYNEYGIGRSLTEDAKTLAVIRSILLFATTISAVKNATGTKTLTLKLEEEEDDPYGSVEMALNVYAETNREAFPINQTHPVDLINSLQAAGLNVVVEGHPAFPDVKMDLQSREGTNKEISPDLDENLRRRHIQVFGLNPENMESVNNADYATQLVNNNLMLLKRVTHYQNAFEPFLTDFIRYYAINSGILMGELTEIAEEQWEHLDANLVEAYKDVPEDQRAARLVKEIIFDLEAYLPKPEDPRKAKLGEEFTAQKQRYEDAMSVLLDEALFDAADESYQQVIEAIPSAKANIVAKAMRSWMQAENYLPELLDLTTATEEGGPAINLLEEVANYQNGMGSTLLEYLTKALPGYKARMKRIQELQKAEEKAGKGGAGAEGGDGGFGESPGGGLDDGGMGDDGLAGDAGDGDMGLDGEPTAGDGGADALSDAGGDDAGLAESGDLSDDAGGDIQAQTTSDDGTVDGEVGAAPTETQEIEEASLDDETELSTDDSVGTTDAPEEPGNDVDGASAEEPGSEEPTAASEEPALIDEPIDTSSDSEATSTEEPDSTSGDAPEVEEIEFNQTELPEQDLADETLPGSVEEGGESQPVQEQPADEPVLDETLPDAGEMPSAEEPLEPPPAELDETNLDEPAIDEPAAASEPIEPVEGSEDIPPAPELPDEAEELPPAPQEPTEPLGEMPDTTIDEEDDEDKDKP